MEKNLILLLMVFALPVFGQNDPFFPDELRPTAEHFNLAISITDFTPDQMNAIGALHNIYRNTNQDSALLLSKKLAEITKDLPTNNLTTGLARVKSLILLGFSLKDVGEYDEAEMVLKEAKTIATNLNFDPFIAQTNQSLGKIAVQKEQYDAALDFFLTSIDAWESMNDSLRLFSTYYDIAGLYFNLEILNKAEEYNVKAELLAEAINDDELKRRIYTSKGLLIAQIVKKYNRLILIQTDSIKRNMHSDSMYYYLDLSIENQKKALAIARKQNNKQHIADNLISLIGSYNNKDDYELALSLSQETEILLKELNSLNLLSRYNNFMSIIHYNIGNYQQALVYAIESAKVAEKLGRERSIAWSDKRLSRLYSDLGQYEKALIHLKKYDQYLLKTNDLEKNKLIADAETKYQSEKKEKENLRQKNDILTLEAANANILRQRNTYIAGSLFLLILTFFAFLFNKTRKDRNDKKAFAEALLLAQEGERKRIARDLHDGIGQSLLLMKKEMTFTHEVTVENQQLITDTLEEVRAISRDLHPDQLEKLGLTTAINDVIERVERSTDLFITKEIQNIDDVFTEKESIHIFRVIQEALNNIIKHAEATAARITIQSIGRDIVIKVLDNGKGFDHELAIIKSKSLGLRTMNERVLSIDGRLKIEKNPPSGTVLTFTIPKQS
jgi:signal transduction histidine kinase